MATPLPPPHQPHARSINDIIVTTEDLPQPYDVIGPVYFKVSNKEIFSSELSKLAKMYAEEISNMRHLGEMSAPQADWGVLYGELSVGQSDFEVAFFISVQ